MKEVLTYGSFSYQVDALAYHYENHGTYLVNEIFHSLKGEGLFTGVPMSFIRLTGCNLECAFCDTPDRLGEELTLREIINSLKYERVVITGGEPTLQDLNPLVEELRRRGFKAHLETNGFHSNTIAFQPWNHFTWIALSPKQFPLAHQAAWYAHEVKFLVGQKGWEQVINLFDQNFGFNLREGCLKMVMPVAKAKGNRSQADLIQKNIDLAIDYCKDHPEYRLCMQMHKILGIP